MEKIIIAGSSFLLPGNVAWKELSKSAEISFAEYGAWLQCLSPTASEGKALGLVFVLEDVFDIAQLPATVSTPESYRSWFARHFEPLTAGLAARLEAVKAPVVLIFGATRSASALENLRSGTPEDLALRWLDETMTRLAAEHPNFFWVSDYRLSSDVGKQLLFDRRNWFFLSCRWSQAGLQHVAGVFRAVFERVYAHRARVLVLDCDNTIWGGVVGEDGLEGLKLGQDGYGRIFAEFQAAAKSLGDKGIVLALCSKNSPDDVWRVFDEHAAMVLTRRDIVAAEISWDAKSEGVKRIAEQLDLGLSSLVFWDDNPLDRAEVRQHCPEVLVVEPPTDIWDWPSALREMIEFQDFSVTADDLRKREQYASRAQFKQGIVSTGDPLAFLRSLRMMATLSPVDASLASRAEQLAQKTNQFNLRVARHHISDIDRLRKDGAKVWLASLRDRFGDHGHTVLLIIRPLENSQWFLDTFLMSCRVLGRRFEDWALSRAVDELRQLGATELIMQYRPSSRSHPAKRWLDTLPLRSATAEEIEGFASLLGEPLDDGVYILPLDELDRVPEGLFQ